MRRFLPSIFIVMLLWFPLAASGQASNRVPGETWQQFVDPAEAGFDIEKLEAARQKWETLPSSAFMVVADGAVVAAWGDVERRFMCHSVRKSFLSALYGIYWDKGEIDLNKNLADLNLDDEPEPLMETEKRARILDLLKARSGVFHPAAYAGRTDSQRRGSEGPGRYFAYNNWDFNTLATILEMETGADVFEDFDRYFAGQLGMQDWRISDGYYHFELDKSKYPAYPFRLSARDAARFGLLFARDGAWSQERILSRHWVRRSSALYSIDNENYGYGFMWWVFREPRFERHGMYAAMGVGNQMIAVLPDSDIVIVNRANTYDGERTPDEALRDLFGDILDARTGVAVESPRLVAMADAELEMGIAELEPPDLETYLGTWPVPATPLGGPARYEFELREEKGQLVMDSPTSGVFRLYPQKDGSFFQEDSHRRFYPVHDDQGAFAGLATAWSIARAAIDVAAKGETARAAKILAFAGTEESIEYQVAHGIVDLVNGNSSMALAHFQTMISEDKANSVEAAINDHGYALMRAGDLSNALIVLETNTDLFPDSPNTWDSFGEALMANEDLAGARFAYQRSLELDAENNNAIRRLEKITSLSAPTLENEIDALMMKARIPGLARAIIDDYEITRVEYYGLSDVEAREGLDAGQLFEAASLSKPVFATIVLRLVERGEFDLDQPLFEILENDRLAHDERSKALTARIVLSHRTGLPNWGGEKLEFSDYPGTAFGYSGEGFVYLQQVIEKLTGSTLDELAKQEIFEPLGMTNSRFSWKEEEQQRLARPHDDIGTPQQKNPAYQANAAASLHTTAADYARFVHAWMRNELLSPAMTRQALLPTVSVPRLGLDLSKPPEVTRRIAWGLGWGLQLPENAEDGGVVVWHWGDNGPFKAFVAFRPETGDGVVYFANASNGLTIGKDLVKEAVGDMSATFRWLDYSSHDDPGFVTRIEAREAEQKEHYEEAIKLYGKLAQNGINEKQNERRIGWLQDLIDVREKPVSIEVKTLESYAGNYGPRKLYVQDGEFWYQREGRDPYRLVALSENLFMLEGMPGFRIEVELGEDGQPDRLVGHYIQGWKDESARND